MTKAHRLRTFTGQKKEWELGVPESRNFGSVFTWSDKMLEKCIYNLITSFHGCPPFIRPDRHIKVIVSIVSYE